MTNQSLTSVISDLPDISVPLARGVRAGDWVFVSGLLPEDLGDRGRALAGKPRAEYQAASLWTQAAEVLESAGSAFSRVVRADQFFEDWRAVPFFHHARRERCASYIAPSTSILQRQMLVPGATMMMDMVALTGEVAVEPIHPPSLDLPSTSSFVPVARAGELVFVAGFLAAHGVGDLGGIAPEAQVPAGHLWKGNRIQLETSYIIREKLIPALESAKLSLGNVAKANVFLSDIEDAPAFNQVWLRAFEGLPPATTIIPSSRPGFAIADATIEINLVGTSGFLGRINDLARCHAVCDGYPLAVRAGDFLLFSGMLASDHQGLIPGARIEARRRYVASSIEAQMEYLLDVAEEVCRASKASLRNVVRAVQAHTDLSDFIPACRVWERRLPGMALPISAVGVPGPLMVPGCSVQLDLWIYAPLPPTQ